jgi:hypothetical protein
MRHGKGVVCPTSVSQALLFPLRLHCYLLASFSSRVLLRRALLTLLLSTFFQLQYEDGSTYDGNFKDDLYELQGKLTTLQGDNYDGTWHNGKVKHMSSIALPFASPFYLRTRITVGGSLHSPRSFSLSPVFRPLQSLTRLSPAPRQGSSSGARRCSL